MKTQQAEVGVWDQYDTQWKSEVQGGLYPDDGDKGRLLFSYRIALEQYLKKVRKLQVQVGHPHGKN